MEWAEVREMLIDNARATRKNLVHTDDFDQLRPVIQYNYILDEAQKHFEKSPHGLRDRITELDTKLKEVATIEDPFVRREYQRQLIGECALQTCRDIIFEFGQDAAEQDFLQADVAQKLTAFVCDHFRMSLLSKDLERS